jgi:hypothetical protein
VGKLTAAMLGAHLRQLGYTRPNFSAGSAAASSPPHGPIIRFLPAAHRSVTRPTRLSGE